MEYVTPVTTTKAFPTSKVIVLVIVIAVLIGIGLFFYWKGSNVKDNISKLISIDIALHNTTPTQHFIDIPTRVKSSRRVVLDPYSSETMRVPVDSLIRSFSHLPSGERINDSFKVNSSVESLQGTADPSQSGPRSFVITHSGIFPERVLSRDVLLSNSSHFPILFVEKVRDFENKRWSSDIIPPMSYITKDLVAPGTMYEVVHPTKESSPIASTVTGLKTSKLDFNGSSISST